MDFRTFTDSLARLTGPLTVQVRVFYRDGWMCRWCHRPTVFSPVFRLLQQLVERSGHAGPLAYFHPRWRRDAAPLLDHLGAVIDHVEAFAAGGASAEANLVTACNKCNARKNSRTSADYQRERPGRPVKGRYGEPQHWDGLASLFLVLAAGEPTLPAAERAWRRALTAHLTNRERKA